MTFDRLKQLDALHWIAVRWPRLTRPLRALTTAAYRMLEVVLGRRHPHVKIARDLRELHLAPMPAPGGPKRDAKVGRVVFFTVRGWFAHATTDVLLAAALKERGLQVVPVLCKGGPMQCDFKPGTDPYVTPGLCRRCRGFAERVFEAIGLDTTSLEDLLREAARVAPSLDHLERGELMAYEHRGHPVGDWAQASAQRSLLRGDIRDIASDIDVLRGFVEACCMWVDATEQLLDAAQPDLIVLTNGQFHAERVVLELGTTRGVDVVAYERGMDPDTAVWRRGEPVVPHRVDMSLQPTRRLDRHEDRELDALLARRAGGDVGYQNLWPSIQRDAREVYERLELDQESPVVVLFTNILWDSAVFRCDVGFDGMMDWVLQVIDEVEARPTVQLVVRVHPSEVRLPMSESRDRVIDRIQWERPSLPDNVRVVPPDDPASSYALLEDAKGIFTYTSTIGLEAACRGHAVAVAGDCHYRAQGFTLDVQGPATLGSDLDEVARPRSDAERRATAQLARRYAHAFFKRYQVPFPWFHDGGRGDRLLRVESGADLRPGIDPELDRLIEWLLAGSAGPRVLGN